ncbi:MAG: hypothetical protein NTW21_26270 [Verrucomicrobia bacterium]|nr:hypothetical protein [Verrucomicrobiota bacterium]
MITMDYAKYLAPTVDLARMMPDAVKGLYSNTSTQSPPNNTLILKQVFSEKCSTGMTINDFYCTSACVVAVQGRRATATNSQLTIPAGKGTFTDLYRQRGDDDAQGGCGGAGERGGESGLGHHLRCHL